MAMKISLGPIPYHWESTRVHQFYRDAAALPVDIVYLGETVCSKRRSMRREDWSRVAQRLSDAGKEVVFSTLALTEAESELSSLGRIAGNGRWLVEANDMAAVHHMAGRVAFIIGPHINIYNDEALAFLQGLGACRWVVPVEIGRPQLEHILCRCTQDMETEMFAYGRLPLAFSARCFSARAHNHGKDDCGFVCIDYPDGLTLNTRDGDPFLVINGIQIQSARTHNLIGHLHELQAAGVDIIRIQPQAQGMKEIVRAFREVMDGTATARLGMQQLEQIPHHGYSDGYWHQQAGMNRL